MSKLVRRARNSWLLSFADLTTLLICFFIMMLALNKTHVEKVYQWVDAQLDKTYQQFESLISTHNLEEVSLTRQEDGILLTLSSPNFFETAKTQPTAELEKQLKVLAPLLPSLELWQVAQHYPDLMQEFTAAGLSWHTDIIIEGHTDNDPIAVTSPLRNNWQLSALRAKEVMLLLQEESQLPEELFTLAGRGEYAPRVANDSPENKAQNRRITIRLNANLLKSIQ